MFASFFTGIDVSRLVVEISQLRAVFDGTISLGGTALGGMAVVSILVHGAGLGRFLDSSQLVLHPAFLCIPTTAPDHTSTTNIFTSLENTRTRGGAAVFEEIATVAPKNLSRACLIFSFDDPCLRKKTEESASPQPRVFQSSVSMARFSCLWPPGCACGPQLSS